MASLSVSDGLVLLNSRRIVLPLPAVKPVLQLLHASHSGINKTLAGKPSLFASIIGVATPFSKLYALYLQKPLSMY